MTSNVSAFVPLKRCTLLPLLLAALLGCVPETNILAPPGVGDGVLAVVEARPGGRAERVVVINAHIYYRAMSALGRDYSVWALYYDCGLDTLKFPARVSEFLPPGHLGRPLPGTMEIFEGQVRDGEFSGWTAVDEPPPVLLEARLDPAGMSAPFPDCEGMGTILDVAGR